MSAAPVLCVEDDEDTRDLLKSLLELSGIEAAGSPNAAAALRMMDDVKFSLYVLDGGLGSASGMYLCERIRASDSDTPIVFFSGHAASKDIEAAMRAGANAYIVKPDFDEVVPTVRRLLEQARPRMGGAQSRKVNELLEQSERVLREARALTRPGETEGDAEAPPG